MLVFSLFFGKVAGNPSSSVPYSLFVLAGLVPWMFFSNAIAQAGQSVVGNQNLVTKIYFPQSMIPMGAVAAGLVDLAISFAMLVVMMLWFGMTPGWSFAVLPFLTLGLFIAALGIGTLLSAFTVAYRDFRHAGPFPGSMLDVRHAVRLPAVRLPDQRADDHDKSGTVCRTI